MNKKELIELLSIIYSKSSSKEENNYSFDTNNVSNKTRVNSLILIILLKIVTTIKEDKVDTYINKKVAIIDLKLTILRAKIAELNNKKNDYKIRITSSKNDYSSYAQESDYSKMIQDLNLEIIDISKQIEILQERKRKLLSASREEVLEGITDRIKNQSIKVNLQELSTYNQVPVFKKISSAIRTCSPDEMLNLAKRHKVITEEYNRNSRINLVPISSTDGFYPSLKLLTDLDFTIKGENYIKTKEDCERVLYSITKFQTTTLRDIKQLLETEYTSDKLDGLRKMGARVNSLDDATDYDFLRLHQGKYDNNLAIQLRGYEQIYEEKLRQTFKTENTLLYINKLRRQISVLRKKIYREITYWYLSQKLFNKILGFNIESTESYNELKDRYKKIAEQMTNYKTYILDAQNILKEVEKKYNQDKTECEKTATSLGLDIALIDDITSNYYLACIDYIEREKVKREIKAFINEDKIQRTITMNYATPDNEILAEKIASTWTSSPSINSIEYEEKRPTPIKKTA